MKKLLLGTILASLLVGCSGGRNSTGYSLINDMMYSVTGEAFSESQVFDNGQTMQAAPKGTVPRGFLPHPMDDEGNPVRLVNPYEMNEYAMQRGKYLYKNTCAACHGDTGKGDGLVVKDGGFPKPPKFKARKWKKINKETGDYRYDASYVYNVITFGLGNMPSHSQQLWPEDRWQVAEYVREKLMKKNKKRVKSN